MASAHEIAADVLRTFGPNVVARRPPLTYGQYAHTIGRDPAEYGLAVGKAMHAIGAICVIRQLPVAPLFWVRRADNKSRAIFEGDALEREYIVDSGDFDTMYVVSREYQYTNDDFVSLERALRKSLESGNVTNWSPHNLWHHTFRLCPKDSSLTYYERAMARYNDLLNEIKSRREAPR